MANIITIPNDTDQVMGLERRRIVPWAPTHGWIYAGYNCESDHLAQIRQAAGGAAIQVLDFDCHGSPGSFNHSSSDTALQFGRCLAQIPGFSANSAVYLDGCNTGLTSHFAPVPIAQTLADGAGCTVYGSKGYLDGTYAEGNEQCSPGSGSTVTAYPGAQSATGRDVWIAFHPRAIRPADEYGEWRSMTVGVDHRGRVWATFDPMASREVAMFRGNSITIQSQSRATRELENLLESTMRSEAVEFPSLRMAPDITINFLRDDYVTILDVYANGGLLRDRISETTWRVSKPDELAALVRRHRRS